MSVQVYRLFLTILFVLGISGSLLAQDAQDASLMRSLLQRYTENYGGLRDANRLSSISIEGVQIQGGEEYRFILRKKRPGSIRYQLEDEHTSLTGIYNGSEGWLRTKRGSDLSIEELSGDRLKILKKEARFESPLYRHQEKPANTVEFERREMLGNIRTFVLRVVEPGAEVSLYYLDPRTSYVLRIDRLNEDDKVAFKTLYRDYKKVGGYPFAHEIENQINGETVSLTRIESIAVNPGLLSFYFEKPEW